MEHNSSNCGSESTMKKEPSNESSVSPPKSTSQRSSRSPSPQSSSSHTNELATSTLVPQSEPTGVVTRRKSKPQTEPSVASKPVAKSQNTPLSKTSGAFSPFKVPHPAKPSSMNSLKLLSPKSSGSISISKSFQSSNPLSPSSALLNKSLKTSSSLPLSSQTTLTRTGQSPKKKPAVKIASFAKSSSATPSPSSSKTAEESESDEDELLVYMQFDAQLDSDLLRPDTAFKIIGMDTEKPVLQLGNQVYEGNWQDMIGTALFFEEDRNVLPGDPVFTKNPAHMLKYHSKTRKTLHMSRVFIKPKDAGPDDNVSEEAPTVADIVTSPTPQEDTVAVIQFT